MKDIQNKYGKIIRISIEFIPDSVFITDPNSKKLIYCNKRAEKLTGYSRKEILKMRADQIYPKDLLKRTMEVFKKHAAGKPLIVETEVLTKDKKRIPTSINSAIIEFDGKPCVLSIFRDITEQKKAKEALKESEKNWEDSFNSLQDIMLIMDKDYNIENINNAGLKLIGKKKQEVIGKKCYKIIHNQTSSGDFCPFKQSSKTKKPSSVDRYEKKFKKYFSIKTTPIFNERGEIIKFVDLMRDITARKKAEIELKKTNEELEKFNKLAIGRELKMIELKKEIKKLKEKKSI